MENRAERGGAAWATEATEGGTELTGRLFLRHRREFLACFISCAACCSFVGAWSAEGLALAAFLAWTAVFDFHYGLIFDRLLVAFAATALCFRFSDGTAAAALFAGAMAGGGPLLLLRMAFPGGIGGGDIKLMAVVGLWLGWRGALLALLLASWGGGLFAAALLLSGHGKRKDVVPFGPFLSLGVWISFLFGEHLLARYGALFRG